MPHSGKSLPPDADHALEVQFIAGLRAGDERMLDRIVSTYYTGLLSYLVSRVHSVDVAEDLLQEMFIRIWRSREMTPFPAGLRAYLYAAARNQMLNYERTCRRTISRNEKLAIEITQMLPDSAELVHEEIDRERLLAAVAAAASQLSPRAREIWVLFRDHDLSYAEIAAILGISVSTVKTQMSRAFVRLRAAAKPFLPPLVLVKR